MANVTSINLNHLVLLDALLETGSVTRAAARVGLTQSGASNGLAVLRLVFDDPLFERAGRGVRPTPRALEVAADLRRGLDALDRVLRPRSFDPSELQRTFVLALPDLVQPVILPSLLSEVGLQAPGVGLQVVGWPTQAAPEGLASGEVDVFVGYLPRVDPPLTSLQLYDDAYVLMLRTGHPDLGESGELPFERWLACGHVVVTDEQHGGTAVDRALADEGHRRRIALRVTNALMLPHVLASTDLVALVDGRLASRLARTGLERLAPPLDLPRSRVRMVWHDRWSEDPGHAWLRSILSSSAQR
ncbi:MAG: LysR family transcriptional regulator [Myxococcales bacterium]|nr:LysR family transcriptional regulator [Myxococcales bacterium]